MAKQFYFAGAFACWLLIAVIMPLSAQSADIRIDRAQISTVTFTDPEKIRFFLEAYLILEEEDVTAIQFIDATANGFGEDDLLKCYPSQKTYFIYADESAQAVLDSIEFTANIQKITDRQAPEIFEGIQPKQAENWILAAILRSLDWHYRDLPMKLYFESNADSTIRFEMWSYNEDSLIWQEPPPPPKTPETTYDLMHVLRSDTLIIADTTYYDQFYVYRSVADTVIMSDREFEDVSRKKQIKYQPGLVPRARKQERP